MGAVINELCDIGISSWLGLRERIDYMDFTHGFVTQQVY